MSTDQQAQSRSSAPEFRVLCVAYTACLVVGQLIKPRVASIPLTLIDVLIIGSLPLIALRIRAPLSIYALLVAFLVPNVALGILHHDSAAIDMTRVLMGWYSCYRFLFPILLIFCYAGRLSSADQYFCRRVVAVGLGFHVLFGIFQAAAIPNFALIYGPEDLPWDYQESRLVSTFLDPNLVSSLFTAAILAYLCEARQRSVGVLSGRGVLLIGCAIAAALTASRGGAIGFILTYGLFLIFNRQLSFATRVKWVVLSVVAGVAVIAVFIQFFGMDFIVRTDRFGAGNSSVGARVINLVILLGVFLQDPFFGAGFNFLTYLPDVRFVMTSGNYADGGMLYLLSSVGIFGVLCLAYVFIHAAGRFNNPKVLVYPAILLAIQSMTTASMYYPLLTIFVVLSALALDETAERGGSLESAAGRAD